MKKLVLVKLGGSLITDKSKPYVAKTDTIKRLAEEIKQIILSQECLIVVGHGGGSFPHVPAKLYQTQKGFINEKSRFGMALVQDAAAELNRIVVKQFLEAEMQAVSINPSSSLVANLGQIVNWYLSPIKMLIQSEIIPVVYGDVVLDKKLGCSILSTEVLLNYLALKLAKFFSVSGIIYLGDTQGVYDEKGRTIPVITPKSYAQLQKTFKASKGIDVTGGMEHKMSEAIKIAKRGIRVTIANGNEQGILEKIIHHKKAVLTEILK